MSDDGKEILINLGILALITVFPLAAIFILIIAIFSQFTGLKKEKDYDNYKGDVPQH